MKKLTNEQVLTLLSLSERHECIQTTSISNRDGVIFIEIHAKDDADFAPCVMAIDEVFPRGQYGPRREFDHQGKSLETYGITDQEEALGYITLFILRTPEQKEKPSTAMESTKETNHIYSTTEVAV